MKAKRSSKKAVPDDPAQSARFIETARKIGAQGSTEDLGAFIRKSAHREKEPAKPRTSR